MDLVLWVAEQIKIIPRSGSSKSFCELENVIIFLDEIVIFIFNMNYLQTIIL